MRSYNTETQSDRQISRRTLIASAAGLPLTGANDRPEPRRIVVAGGHPGDPEYGCGGTAARYADLGHRVTLLYLNRGEKGCAGAAAGECGALRTAEARKACGILNASAAFAGQVDGEAVVDAAHYDAFRLILEALQPDIVFTHWPIDGHRDHRAMSTLVYDAWQRTNGKFALFYYEVSTGEDTLMFAPTDYVDVTAVESRKRAACYAHASQTPDRYYALQSEVMRFRGIESGYKLAEAFTPQVGNKARSADICLWRTLQRAGVDFSPHSERSATPCNRTGAQMSVPAPASDRAARTVG